MDKFMHSTIHGDIECIQYGKEGPLILALHGTPGKAEQIEVYLKDVVSKYKCRVLSWSRPGYGGTSISVGKTFAEQASVAVSLLDMFDDDSCFVYAVGGGSGVAYQFSVNYPDKCLGLIIESGANQPNDTIGRYTIFKEGSILNKLVIKYFPRASVKILLSRVGNLNKVELKSAVDHIIDNKIDLFKEFVESLDDRISFGTENDNIQIENAYPLSNIGSPLLSIHGTNDAYTDISHADHLISTVKNSDPLLEIFAGTHVLPLSNRTRMISKHIIKFIERCK